MCLDRLKEFPVRPYCTDGSVRGWKVFAVDEKNRKLRTDTKGFPVKKGWNIAETYDYVLLHTAFRQPYRRGFHIMTSIKGARRWGCYGRFEVILPVYFMPEDIMAQGTQFEHNCVVTKRMWIEEHDYDQAVKKMLKEL